MSSRPPRNPQPPKVTMSEEWRYEDGSPVPPDARERIKEHVGREMGRVLLDTEMGRTVGIALIALSERGADDMTLSEVNTRGLRLAAHMLLAPPDTSAGKQELDRELDEYISFLTATFDRWPDADEKGA